MVSDGGAREGILTSTTFPGLIYSILSRRETGVLTLTDGASVKSIYTQSGRPTFAGHCSPNITSSVFTPRIRHRTALTRPP